MHFIDQELQAAVVERHPVGDVQVPAPDDLDLGHEASDHAALDARLLLVPRLPERLAELPERLHVLLEGPGVVVGAAHDARLLLQRSLQLVGLGDLLAHDDRVAA